MKKIIISYNLITIFLVSIVLTSCKKPDAVHVTSPNGKYKFELRLENSKPIFKAYFENQEIIRESGLGLRLSDSIMIGEGVMIGSVKNSDADKSWKPIYGEKSLYPVQYNQTIITFNSIDKEKPVFHFTIRAYNEGIAFRYQVEHTKKTSINAELTEFALPEETMVWTSESAQGEITKGKISELRDTLVERPLLAQLGDSLFVALGEAALVDFARMKFYLNQNMPATLSIVLDSIGVINGDIISPWRTIMAGNSAGEILENNYLLLNLNEPNKIINSDWIKPGKVIREVTLTTQGGLACVDFAVKHNLQYVHFDAGWYGDEYDKASDATTITVDPNRSKGPLDLHRVIEYGKSKGIGVILYVNGIALEQQLDSILPLVKSWGVKGLKYGFVQVGSQEHTSWLHEAVRKAADYELMVDIHDEYRPTGYSRTYPNLMTQEGIRGDEASPDNTMVLKTLFVRMLAGAGDHTNCYFSNRVEEKLGSHASQLAKVVCIYSPWQFLYWYDRPVGSPHRVGGAGGSESIIVEVPELSFFDQVPTVWDDTKIIEGYPGEYAVVARRSGSTWFLGALNGLRERDFTISFDILDPKFEYEATVYSDNKEIDTPTNVEIDTLKVTSKDKITKRIGKHEGMALILKKLTH